MKIWRKRMNEWINEWRGCLYCTPGLLIILIEENFQGDVWAEARAGWGRHPWLPHHRCHRLQGPQGASIFEAFVIADGVFKLPEFVTTIFESLKDVAAIFENLQVIGIAFKAFVIADGVFKLIVFVVTTFDFLKALVFIVSNLFVTSVLVTKIYLVLKIFVSVIISLLASGATSRPPC